MLIAIIELAFVTLGVKILLAVAVIYALFPSDRRCPHCDAETLPLVSQRGLVRLGRLVRVRRRWCPGCGDHYLARYRSDDAAPVTPQAAEQPARPRG
ncbi:MAG TPA: hypothetical protein VFQ38_14430 [Longimicrobiales bacterium]|nr:hypothetical protein [Longimicrobiales bacterium]